jgi:hypothetical protein
MLVLFGQHSPFVPISLLVILDCNYSVHSRSYSIQRERDINMASPYNRDSGEKLRVHCTCGKDVKHWGPESGLE